MQLNTTEDENFRTSSIFHEEEVQWMSHRSQNNYNERTLKMSNWLYKEHRSKRMHPNEEVQIRVSSAAQVQVFFFDLYTF